MLLSKIHIETRVKSQQRSWFAKGMVRVKSQMSMKSHPNPQIMIRVPGNITRRTVYSRICIKEQTIFSEVLEHVTD